MPGTQLTAAPEELQHPGGAIAESVFWPVGDLPHNTRWENG